MNLAPNCPLEQGSYEATLPCGQKFISERRELPLHIITKRIGFIDAFGGDIEEIIEGLETRPVRSVKECLKKAMKYTGQKGKSRANTCLKDSKADWK